MAPVTIEVAPHPLLALGAFETELPDALGELASPDWLQALLSLEADAPVSRSEALRQQIRTLLRQGGYKPTGRGKPASEYLVKAAAGGLGSINLVVDACNAVSLHSALPISVVDRQRLSEPLSVRIAQDERYVFNASGQSIELAGLLCLYDAEGPCANAVKDSQRTKTSATTRRTLSLVWGTRDNPAQLARAVAWYRELLERTGATTTAVI